MSIKSRDAILVWLGGVVTELIPEITMQIIQMEQSSSSFFRLRGEIMKLSDELSLGLRSTRSYCEQVIKITNSIVEINNLEELIPAKASLNEPVMVLLNSMPTKFEKLLISDFPESWFQIIASNTNLSSQFPLERTIFTARGNLAKMVPNVFEYITSASGHSLNDCILIDSIPSRAVEAVRCGLSAIVYVYPEKLEHELALRGIKDTDVELLHPRDSRRVNTR